MIYSDFWILATAVTVVCIIIVTYYLVILLRDASQRLRDLDKTIKNVEKVTENLIREQEMVDDIITQVKSTATDVSESVSTIKNQFLVPFTFVSSLVQTLKQYFEQKADSEELSENENNK